MFDVQGHRRGELLVSLNVAGLLYHLRVHAGAGIHLADAGGHELIDSEPEDAAAHQPGLSDGSLAQRHPQAWQHIEGAVDGEFEDADGYWVFHTVRAPRMTTDSSVPAADAFTGPVWKLIHLTPRHEYDRALWLARARAAVPTLLVLLLLGWQVRRTSRLLASDSALHHDLVRRSSELQLEVEGRRLAELQARKFAQESLDILDAAGDGFVLLSETGRILQANSTYCSLLGYERHELIGQTPRMLQSGRHDASFYASMRHTLAETGHWSGEVWNRRKNGEIYPQLLSIGAVPLADEGSVNYIALATDITSQKRLQVELERMAHFDTLTNLPNRLLLQDRLGQALLHSHRHHTRVAVVFLDLDGFKAVNDKHGHPVGDRLLVALADRMRGNLRENDTIARLGGDEFVAVLVDLPDAAACLPLVESLTAAAREPVHLAGMDINVSASVGVALYPQSEPVDADQLLRQADQAMYQAKLAGKNRHVMFDAESERDMRSTHEALDDLRRGLVAGEMALHYQPQVNLRLGRVVGVEALIRWRHPQRGLLSPAAFLPLIEDHLLSIDVDEWVLDAALAQMAGWRDAGLDLEVSVNVSAHLLQLADFTQRLERL